MHAENALTAATEAQKTDARLAARRQEKRIAAAGKLAAPHLRAALLAHAFETPAAPTKH